MGSVRKKLYVGLTCAMALASPVASQDQNATLADMRQELAVLFVELKKLKRELSTTGGVSTPSVGGSVIDRVSAIEQELQRLTAKAEQLEFRIDRVVTDGTNRVGDLEFRICELEPGCDIANLQPGDTLGGVAPATTGAGQAAGSATSSGQTGTDAVPSSDGGVQLAVGEQADFDAAKTAFDQGEYQAAAQQFALFQANYPGSPLGGKAGLFRGAALEELDDLKGAARAYLDTFSAAPDGPEAPDALLSVGKTLALLGQRDQACMTINEVISRFPGSSAAAQAPAGLQSLGCS